MFISMLIAGLLLTNWLMNKISVKWSILFGFITYLIYVIGQFYVTKFGLIFTGLLVGIGASAMWCSLGVYVTQVKSS